MELLSLVARLALPAPVRPSDPPAAPAPLPVDWAAVEGRLGLRLPADYKRLVSACGPLELGGRLWLHAPCERGERFEYGDWLWETHRECRIASRRTPPYQPPPFHPEPGGLLAWGETRDGVRLFWDTGAHDDPDRWPVVAHDRNAGGEEDPWRRWGTTLTETVAALLADGLPLPRGRTLGPLPATACRTAFLVGARPWTPPERDPEPAPEAGGVRRAALTGGNGLEALTRLVPPPATPYLGDGTWEWLFEELGTRLPDEYVTLMERYGSGHWGNWLGFFTPLRTAGNGLAHHARRAADTYRGLRGRFPEHHPLAVWPEPGGFLPFAVSVEGDYLGWLTEGEPDDWPVAVWPRRAGQGPPLAGTLTDVLLEWLRGDLVTEGLAGLGEEDDPLAFAGFSPGSDDTHW
ncbi:SMI1/KNR4 family protein [Streptomyces sp. URMC 125]|uniref:SMI1/KNR4 family protein n=1 Tax=Streptomyces sp. URMC 125 TaxID=3423419 RepID=UPI003F1B3AD3